MHRCVVACARSRVTQRLIGLIDQFGPSFRFLMESRRMGKAVRMPDLNLFMPGFFEISVRCGGQEFEQRIVICRSFVSHEFLSLSETKCNGVGEGGPG